ncbi:MAG: Radical SAM superfamily protein [Firmicutes bacterium ADurb.Bin182]|nr:MAG: Radical SAM superfamily protein [Firmicutes bacterium ADurb.Bin182]
MKHKVVGIEKDSIAEEIGVKPGFKLLTVNGEEIFDVVDYEQLTTRENLVMTFLTREGKPFEAEIEKELYEPVGLLFESGLMSSVKNCKNHCIFCFIDQMPKTSRSSLLVKDDDWRLSLFMGNYVTLTNVSEAEFQRILKRRVSPLFISVHATDPEIRYRMMRNPSAKNIMTRLKEISNAGLRFHSQIVLCPGINDGDVLKQTLADLLSLYPASQSAAVVPVGLTRHREGLAELTVPDSEQADETIDIVEEIQRLSLKKHGTAFVFASDEFYILAKRDLPLYGVYEEFPQLENGVGLLRKFEHEFIEELKDRKPVSKLHRLDGATGVAAFPFLQKLFDRLKPYGISVDLHPVINEYFGERVTVAGLITASDMAKQLKSKLTGHKLIIPWNMMRENEPVFLDNIRLDELKNMLQTDIIPMCPYDGGKFIESLFAMSDERYENE